MFERYAIFYTPPAGPMADFAARWLGWDSATGRAVKHPDIAGLDVAAITAVPRKYGFHATLKAPFALADGTTPDALATAVQSLAQDTAPVDLAGLALGHGHRFVALRPMGDQTALNAFAGKIVRTLDAFRAPLSDADIARRRRAGLSARQDQQMLDWGYPFIFDDFHFHLTLSGPVDDVTGPAVVASLTPLVVPAFTGPLTIDAITLMGQDAQGMFHQIHRYALTG